MLLGKIRQLANLQTKLSGVIVGLSFLVFGCESPKYSQCEPIFAIARDVNQSNQNLNQVSNRQSLEMKVWLQAAHQFTQADARLRALRIESRELMQYQNQLARIYRIYAQATYDAVRARENKNFSALESARNNAAQAGILQRQLIQEINTYCLDLE
ncbi:MAG: hypothetical protein AAFO95_03850 [Cyanobacteria bacterium J06600_6]